MPFISILTVYCSALRPSSVTLQPVYSVISSQDMVPVYDSFNLLVGPQSLLVKGGPQQPRWNNRQGTE